MTDFYGEMCEVLCDTLNCNNYSDLYIGCCKFNIWGILEGCYILAWAAKRLRQYMLNHMTWLISKMDPIKYIFEKPALTGRIARWQMLLSEYDIEQQVTKESGTRA